MGADRRTVALEASPKPIEKQYSTGEMVGITVGSAAAVIAVVGLYFGASRLWAKYKHGRKR